MFIHNPGANIINLPESTVSEIELDLKENQMLSSKKSEELAAIRIQSVIRGNISREKTNLYGESEGKEIEIYLPWGFRKIGSDVCSYEMIGYYKYTVCESDLFSVQIDHMHFREEKENFSNTNTYMIPEVVTSPYCRPGESRHNLYTEKEIDIAVGDFISILDASVKQAAENKIDMQFISLKHVMDLFNQKHLDHPLRMSKNLRTYLQNPQSKKLFTNEMKPVEKHQNIEIGFIYQPNCFPLFDKSNTPRTLDASIIVNNNGYLTGNLLIHIQKTFSLAIEKYRPEVCDERFNHTTQQINYLKEARKRAENFLQLHPPLDNANKEKILGLLTICVEHVITVTKPYKGLHEDIDKPFLSIRHILHYVKNMICNDAEHEWFNDMFRYFREDINNILCENSYVPTYRPSINHGHSGERYDVIFDLFGNYANCCALDRSNPEDAKMAFYFSLFDYGMKSWKDIYHNHMSLSGRTHLNLQKVIDENGNTEFHPLFEARRIGLMTIEEFKQGKSCISLGECSTRKDEIPSVVSDHDQEILNIKPQMEAIFPKIVALSDIIYNDEFWECHLKDQDKKYLLFIKNIHTDNTRNNMEKWDQISKIADTVINCIPKSASEIFYTPALALIELCHFIKSKNPEGFLEKYRNDLHENKKIDSSQAMCTLL